MKRTLDRKMETKGRMMIVAEIAVHVATVAVVVACCVARLGREALKPHSPSRPPAGSGR